MQESSVVDREEYYEVEVACLGRGNAGQLLFVEAFMGGCIMSILKTCRVGSCGGVVLQIQLPSRQDSCRLVAARHGLSRKSNIVASTRQILDPFNLSPHRSRLITIDSPSHEVNDFLVGNIGQVFCLLSPPFPKILTTLGHR